MWNEWTEFSLREGFHLSTLTPIIQVMIAYEYWHVMSKRVRFD